MAVLQRLDCFGDFVHLELLVFGQRIGRHVELHSLSKVIGTAAGIAPYQFMNFVYGFAVLAPLFMEHFHVFFFLFELQGLHPLVGMPPLHLHGLVYRVKHHHLLEAEPVFEA